MFQYSDKLDWSGPHYEKLLNIQRDAMRAYVLAYQIGRDPADLAATRHRPLADGFHAQPSGASTPARMPTPARPSMATSSTPRPMPSAAPARSRRSTATPTPARMAGRSRASPTLHDVTGDRDLLDAAQRAFDWTLANRRAPNGGFGHARAADDDTHLGDTLAMAEAALALYRSTAERRYLALATELGEIIVRDHRDPAGGYMVRQPDPGAKGVLAKP